MWTPTGASLLAAAWRARARLGAGDPALVLPIYTRLSDAEENEAVRAGKQAATHADSGVGGPGGRTAGRAMSARLRPMREEDVRFAVADRVAISFPVAWSAGMFLDELLQGDSRYWVVADSPWGVARVRRD